MNPKGHLIGIAVSPASSPRQVQDLIGPLTGHEDLVAILRADGLILEYQICSRNQKVYNLGSDGNSLGLLDLVFGLPKRGQDRYRIAAAIISDLLGHVLLPLAFQKLESFFKKIRHCDSKKLRTGS